MGGFFPKVDEKYGDGDREYNWWFEAEPSQLQFASEPVGLGF